MHNSAVKMQPVSAVGHRFHVCCLLHVAKLEHLAQHTNRSHTWDSLPTPETGLRSLMPSARTARTATSSVSTTAMGGCHLHHMYTFSSHDSTLWALAALRQ